MKYRSFSDTGWKVSEIGLGCWQIGWCWGDVSDYAAKNLLFEAVDKVINFFDTSDMYGDGRSEKLLSELIKSSNNRIYVTTKLGRRTRGTNYQKGYKHAHMEEFIDRSLKNLNIECIDLLQLHCPPNEICSDPKTYELLDKIVQKGKISHYGVSVHNLDDAYSAIKFPNVKSIQLVFNMFRQKPLDNFFQEAKNNNVAVIARGPLASGLLAGDINENTIFPKDDHRNYNIDGSAFNIGDTFSGVNLDKGIAAVKEIKKVISEDNIKISQFALKWILSFDEVTVAIPGAINSNQVKINAMASELKNINHHKKSIRKIYEKHIKQDVHHKW